MQQEQHADINCSIIRESTINHRDDLVDHLASNNSTGTISESEHTSRLERDADTNLHHDLVPVHDSDIPCPESADLSQNESGEIVCTLCDKLFENNSVLLTHLFNQHDMRSFYTCKLCEMIYANCELLDLHLKTDHSIHSAAPCPACNEVYIDKVELEHHIMAEHSNRAISPGYTECYQVSAHCSSEAGQDP